MINTSGRTSSCMQANSLPVRPADDHLRLAGGNPFSRIAPFARGLQRRLYGLDARVHQERHFHAGQLMELLVQERELVVPEGARRERQAPSLLRTGFQNARVTVSLADSGIPGQTIEVPVAFDVPDPDAFTAFQHDVERLVVVRAV